MAGLIVNAMVSIVEALLDAPANSPAAERRSGGSPRSSSGWS